VVLLDLDGLKRINDEHGHAAGDEVLAAMGRVITRHVRSDDVPARLGGDECAVVMPDTDKRGAFSLARRLWSDLEETPVQLADGTLITIAVSIGLAGFPWGGETTEEMIQRADADMYANKMSRRMAREAVVAEATALTQHRMPRDATGDAEGAD
jgi:diguanylate cyclase (GGDEF)-like protein